MKVGMANEPKRLLLVEADRSHSRELEGVFRELNYEVVLVPSADAALNQFKSGRLDLVLASADGAGRGFDLCKTIRENKGLKSTPVVLMSGAADADSKFAQHKKGGIKADAYVKYPSP